MAQLLSFRRGWENELLASFILSKFSFLANPVTVSDDIGSDFFCTLFKTRIKDGRSYLFPKNSFAIQIKSNTKRFDFTNNIKFLMNLEIPFFVGVVNRDNMMLDIYSGEYIPIFLATERVEELFIEPTSEVSFENYSEETGTGRFILRFPKVFEFSAEEATDGLQDKVAEFSRLCFFIQESIASRISREYIFGIRDSNLVVILAGRGSATTFRRNFFKRLAEVFRNMGWLHQNRRAHFDLNEYQIYKNLIDKMKRHYTGLPSYLVESFNEMQVILESDD